MIKQWLSAIILSAVSKIRRLNGRQITPSLTSQIMKTIQDSISKMEILLRKIKMGILKTFNQKVWLIDFIVKAMRLIPITKVSIFNTQLFPI